MNKHLFNTITYKAVTMKRSYKRIIMLCADLIVLPFALWSGYALRLSELWPERHLLASWWLFLAVPIIGIFIFIRLGLYRAVVRFMGAQAIWAVVKGVLLLASFIWVAAFLFKIEPFPRSVPINFALAALVYVGGSRLLIRNYYHWLLKHYVNKEAVMIYGAGGAGIQLATALSDGKEYYPVAFLDDDSSLWGATIKGLPVAKPSDIGELLEKFEVKHILLALPNASINERRYILESLEKYPLHVQTIPSMPEILSGKAQVSQLRELAIEDLLGRDPVPAQESLLKKCIFKQIVMITGAGGSIGSEICRQVIRCQPKAIVVHEISEYSLYRIEQELLNLKAELNTDVLIYAILGSVCDKSHIGTIVKHFGIETIYHAAAYKHVPIVEKNIITGVKNNVLGTKVLAETAAELGVKRFILVSTDKAVRPTNVMGASKRFAELILQDLAKRPGKTMFSMVRFGNVLGSSGSVVPLFRKQIAEGGPITVTHKEITRYFMTIPEAACLVIQAGAMAEGGDVFVLDMGESIKIYDLAKRMIQLAGLELKTEKNPEADIAIEIAGLRPGEKLYEELLIGDNVIGTQHPKILRANEESLEHEVLLQLLDAIETAINKRDSNEVRSLLKQSVDGFKPVTDLVDHLNNKETPEKTVIPLR